MLDSGVLVLNRSYQPIHVTSVKRAFALLYQGIARAIDREYRLFDFVSWASLSAETHPDSVGTVSRRIRVTRVIVLLACEHLPRAKVRFSRHNIYLRDGSRCQYCGKGFPRTDLNLDHVVPRSRGGTTTWENVVCSCIACNLRKGGRTPDEAGMKLLAKPVRPKWSPFHRIGSKRPSHQDWGPFLQHMNLAEASYWNTELLED